MKICAVHFTSLSFGLSGAELTDFVLVLNTKEAVKTFSHFGNVQLGGNVSSEYLTHTHTRFQEHSLTQTFPACL